MTLGFIALTQPSDAQAQLREILAKSISVSPSEAELDLRFRDGSAFTIRLDDGTIFVDGVSSGSYTVGDPLDEAFRNLLGQAVALEDGALAELLASWSRSAELEELESARLIAEVLEASVRDIDEDADVDQGAVSVSVGTESSLVELLVGSLGRLGALEEAMEGLDQELRLRIHVDEDVTIDSGEVASRSIVVIGSDLRIEGEVLGDVVVVGGTLELPESGIVHGEARLADTRILLNDGEIRGGLTDLLESERIMRSGLRERIRQEVREELRRDLGNEIRSAARLDDDGFSIMTPFRPVIRGVGGVVEKLIMVLVLGLIGAGFFAVAGENVDRVAETARHAPGRAVMVGFAGTFLLIPIWLFAAAALAISIIGIPLAIAWLPLFPVVVALAVLLGYVAVARNAGEWLSDSSWPWTGWIRKENPISSLFGGLLGLTFAFLAGHVMSVVPLLGVFSILLFVIGGLLTFFVAQIGFGAVLLTWGGQRREYDAYDADPGWAQAVQADVDEATFGAESAPMT